MNLHEFSLSLFRHFLIIITVDKSQISGDLSLDSDLAYNIFFSRTLPLPF